MTSTRRRRFRVLGPLDEALGELEIDEERSVSELGSRAAALAGLALPPPEGWSLVMALSPQRWVQLECPQSFSVASWLRNVELLESVWGSRGDMDTRTVDMTIANLRRKIERDPARPRIIRTVRGVGYAWGERPEEP